MFKLVYMLVVAGNTFGTVTVQTPMEHDACVAMMQAQEETDRVAAFVEEETGMAVEAIPVCHPFELPGRPA
jgi:hypothetical protein